MPHSLLTGPEFFKIKSKGKPRGTHRVLAHQLSIGHDLNQVDDDDHGVQNVRQEHVLVQGHPLAAKTPGKKSNTEALAGVKVLEVPFTADERIHRNK